MQGPASPDCQPLLSSACFIISSCANYRVCSVRLVRNTSCYFLVINLLICFSICHGHLFTTICKNLTPSKPFLNSTSSGNSWGPLFYLDSLYITHSVAISTLLVLLSPEMKKIILHLTWDYWDCVWFREWARVAVVSFEERWCSLNSESYLTQPQSCLATCVLSTSPIPLACP